MNIYLDNAATTRPYQEVMEVMRACQESNFGNASSISKPGIQSATTIEKSRSIIAKSIGGLPEEIFFTSGGTEANNLAILGVAYANKRKGNHIITSVIEHPSIYEPVRWLSANGFDVTFLPVDSKGFIDPQDVLRAITPNTILVSVMHANNEIGTIEPIAEIGEICRGKGVLSHTDGCQSFTKTRLNVTEQHLDLVSLNGHKIHGPKGVGAMYIRSGCRLNPLWHGGGQEGDFRPGTYNTPGIAGFGKAVEVSQTVDLTDMAKMRDDFIDDVTRSIDGAFLNGPLGDARLPNNINLYFRGVGGKQIFTALNKRGVYISTGSACSSTKLTPSRVLLSIGQDDEMANGAIRLSISNFTTPDQLDYVVQCLVEIVEEERKNNGN